MGKHCARPIALSGCVREDSFSLMLGALSCRWVEEEGMEEEEVGRVGDGEWLFLMGDGTCGSRVCSRYTDCVLYHNSRKHMCSDRNELTGHCTTERTSKAR